MRNPRLLPELPVHGITSYHDNTSGLLELSKMHTKHFKKRNQFLLQHKSMTAGEKARQSVPLLPREDSGGCVFCDQSRAAPTPAFRALGLQGPHTPQHGPAVPAAASSMAAWAGSSHYLATRANSVRWGRRGHTTACPPNWMERKTLRRKIPVFLFLCQLLSFS